MSEEMQKDLTILFTQSGFILNSYSSIPLKPRPILKSEINGEISVYEGREREVYNHYRGNYEQILTVISSLITKDDLENLFQDSFISALENKQYSLIKNRVIIHLYEMLIDSLEDNKILMVQREIKLDFIRTITYFLYHFPIKVHDAKLEDYLKSVRNNLAFLYDGIEESRMSFEFTESHPLIWKSKSLSEFYGLSEETYTKLVADIVGPILSFALYNLYCYYEDKDTNEEMLEAIKITIRTCLLFYGVKDMNKFDELLENYQDSEEFNDSFKDCLNSYYHDNTIPNRVVLGRIK